MEILGYTTFVIMGITLGLIGGGGSILTVPILVYIFKFDPLIATSYSLLIVGLSSIAGVTDYYKKNLVNIRTAILFSIPSLTGVFLVRNFALNSIPDFIQITHQFSLSKKILIMLVFAVVMLTSAKKMIWPKEIKPEQNLNFKNFRIIIYGLVIGLLAGFVGAGGGFLIVPALVVILNLPMRTAIGTSLTIIAIQSTLGFMLSAELNSINWSFILTAIALGVLGILIGTRLNPIIPEKKLKTSFGYFVLIIGLIILSEQTIQAMR